MRQDEGAGVARARRLHDGAEEEVHAGRQQRVEDDPRLPDDRPVVLRLEVGAGEVPDETAPFSQVVGCNAASAEDRTRSPRRPMACGWRTPTWIPGAASSEILERLLRHPTDCRASLVSRRSSALDHPLHRAVPRPVCNRRRSSLPPEACTLLRTIAQPHEGAGELRDVSRVDQQRVDAVVELGGNRARPGRDDGDAAREVLGELQRRIVEVGARLREDHRRVHRGNVRRELFVRNGPRAHHAGRRARARAPRSLRAPVRRRRAVTPCPASPSTR